jgi:hypothetical protein
MLLFITTLPLLITMAPFTIVKPVWVEKARSYPPSSVTEKGSNVIEQFWHYIEEKSVA